MLAMAMFIITREGLGQVGTLAPKESSPVAHMVKNPRFFPVGRFVAYDPSSKGKSLAATENIPLLPIPAHYL